MNGMLISGSQNYGGYIERLVALVDRLGLAWAEFYARKIGQDVPVHEFEYGDRDILDSIKFIKNSRTLPVLDPGSQSTKRKNKLGRNPPCPCGSGKKYKKCHGA